MTGSHPLVNKMQEVIRKVSSDLGYDVAFLPEPPYDEVKWKVIVDGGKDKETGVRFLESFIFDVVGGVKTPDTIPRKLGDQVQKDTAILRFCYFKGFTEEEYKEVFESSNSFISK